MPPLRSAKYKERIALALAIERFGIVMQPYGYCERNSRSCVLSKDNSSRCSECVRRGDKCDVDGPSLSDLSSILREKERLSQEWRNTQAKLLRLDRQREFLEKRAGEMIRRGLKTMDELDEAEEKEKQMELEQAATAAMLSSGPRPDAPAPGAERDPFAGLEVPLLPPEVWADWDFAGESLQPSQGN
jgi:hypothetical protein